MPVQIVVEQPDWSFALIVQQYGPKPTPVPTGIHPTAIIGNDVTLGQDVAIGPYVVIGDGARLGDGAMCYPHVVIGDHAQIGAQSTLYAHVTIRERCVLGERVMIHSGTVVGSDGFGYAATIAGSHHKIPQIGTVEIGHDVEIGANVAIDRARFGVTKIGSGTKIDNLVQIAHNVELDEHCLVVSQVGVAGSTTVGKYTTLAGQSGIGGHLKIGAQVVVAARSGVSKNIPDKAVVQGQPAIPLKEQQRQQIITRRQGQTNAALQQELAQLQQRLADLELRLGSHQVSADE